MDHVNLPLSAMTKILAIPGSLRANSSSNLILKAIISYVPEGSGIEVYDAVGALPHFNDPEQVPREVASFKEKIRDADAVLICTPEYAFGIPGSLKNALDWTVGSGEFVGKPVALVTASSEGEKGHAAMLLVLNAISARVIEESTLVISSVRATLDPQGNIRQKELEEKLKAAVKHLVNVVPKKINTP